jgi:hypothetical protein
MSNKFMWVFPALFLAAHVEATNIKDGLWEITGRLDMPGMPANLPPVKHTQCLTGSAAVPHQPENAQDCKVSNLKQDGNGVSWAIQCRSPEGTVDNSGKATYRGDAMDGAMNVNVRDNRGKDVMKMTYRITGKRLGECNP